MAPVFMLSTRKLVGGIHMPEVIDIPSTDRDTVHGMHFCVQGILHVGLYVYL